MTVVLVNCCTGGPWVGDGAGGSSDAKGPINIGGCRTKASQH
jgi:hypothetical protein